MAIEFMTQRALKPFHERFAMAFSGQARVTVLIGRYDLLPPFHEIPSRNHCDFDKRRIAFGKAWKRRNC